MNLNQCEKKEFTCLDGECIDMEFRCDRNYNCNDRSDEKNCTIITRQDYNKNVPPPMLIKDGIDRKTNIYISIDIFDTIEISEMESKFTLNFLITTEWSDAGVTFISLDNETYRNIINDTFNLTIM